MSWNGPQRRLDRGFNVEDFLGGGSEASSSYKEFIALVAEICGESAERHQARTMFNILTSANKEKKERIEVAVSHFSLRGTLFKRELDKLHSLAQVLKKAKQNGAVYATPAANTGDAFTRYLEGLGLQYDTPEADFRFADSVSVEEEKEERAPPQKQGSGSGSDAEAVWFLGLVEGHLSSSGGSAAFESASAFATELQNVCSLHSSDPDMMQGTLFELIGESGFELMLKVMEHAGRIAAIPAEALASTTTATATATAASYPSLPDIETIEIESMSANQRRKHEAKKKKQEESMRAMEEAQLRQMERGGKVDWLRAVGFDQEYLEQERGLGLEKYKQQVSGESKWVEDLKDTYGIHGLGLDHSREKKGLGAGAERKTGPGFEEVNIPAPKKKVLREEADLVKISSLKPSWAQLAFEGTHRLNTIQSEVYTTAYNENQNMLICAPTGAGKTNIAMLAFAAT